MAEPSRTVRVSGLPTDTEDDRLRDKLLIYFLRTRNGGGEIDSVTIVKTTPGTALITFEDSKVAKRVIQQSPHILVVDGKSYEVIVIEHHESLDPNKVIPRLSALVDDSQLPGGLMALSRLCKSHPDVQMNYDAAVKLYTLHGPYSKVQAALMQLLGHPDVGQPASSGSGSVLMAQRPCTQEPEDQSRKPNKQKERKENVHAGRPTDEYSSGSHRGMTPRAYDREDTGQAEGAAVQLPAPPAMSEEDFLLIVDADMFQYLQKYCRNEYQQILRQYGVDVVEMTNQGLTSLFLQVATGVGVDGRDQECLKLARQAMSSFFQENETKICRAQLPKSVLSSRGGLQRAKENLSIRLPKLLLNEDEENIYIIGSSKDVSEAKQFLLDQRDMRAKKEDVASLIGFPSYDSGPSSHADELKLPLTTFSSTDSVDDGIDQLLRLDEDERKSEGARKYKLAARFKDSKLVALRSKPTDFNVRGGLSSPSRSKCSGPVLGYNVLSETAEDAGERVSRAPITGGDILFNSRDVLPSAAFTQNQTSSDSDLIDTRHKSLTPTFSATQAGSTPFPPAGSEPTLKRASSFSGVPQQKAHVMSQRSQDDSSKSAVRARTRSSSFSSQTGRDKQVGHNAELTVSLPVWRYIREAYSTRVDDLTSDVQMKESRLEGSGDLTVILRGASQPKVSSCQLGLQKLVDSVNEDFSVHLLHFSELGITDAADETLQACCADVRSRFKKVTFHFAKKSLFLLGPQQLCSQVGASLREVFSGDSLQRTEEPEFCTPCTSNRNPSTFLQTSEDQSASRHSNSQVMLQTLTSDAVGTSIVQGRRTNTSNIKEADLSNGSISQLLPCIDPVFREKVKLVGTMGIYGQKAIENPSKTGNDKSVNGVGATPTSKEMAVTKQKTLDFTQKDSLQQRDAEMDDSPEESKLAFVGPGCVCMCGESEKLMMRTKCGATLCSKCLDAVHVRCRVCHETAPKPRGIQGKMSHAKLHISVPGHKKDSVIKITYCIPDGIQKEGQPSPGKPFQGGVFEAYLPDCEKTRQLLPRLEKAFKQGLTFTVVEKDTEAMVTWDCIPHKTSLHGGKSGNGYPDSTYFTRLSEVLSAHGIEEPPAKS